MSLTPSTPAAVRPEHPRPDFVREPWINLNGRWRFAFDPDNVGEQMRWHRLFHLDTSAARSASTTPNGDPFVHEIVVPFPWESKLSGVCNPDYKGAAWYQRSIVVPAEWADEDATSDETAGGARRWRRKPFLCFGAVDWSAKVWVNGRFAGEHVGGYTPFALDLSLLVAPNKPATITVRAYDACDADTLLGKQTYDWYTHSGGIWQTVWLEGRPHAHLSQIQVTPELEQNKATFRVGIDADQSALGKAYRLSIASLDNAFPEVSQLLTLDAVPAEATLDVPVPDPKPWSPENPHLYDCVVRLEEAAPALTPSPFPNSMGPFPISGRGVAGGRGEGGGSDQVQTYFGLRTISKARHNDNPYEFVFLNGEPVYLRGVLDQAFHPDGLHTYPSDDAIRADVETAKNLGLNMLRCHIKINEPRYYYWADKLGVLVMYDLPSASVYTPTARAHWERALRDALGRDHSHPCIFAWILFNETWGLEEHQTAASWAWVAQMFDLAKQLDPTRLVEDNSACLFDHVKTDINTWHFYIADYDRARRHTEHVVQQTFEGSGFNYVSARFGHVEGATGYKQGAEPFLNSEYAGLGASGGDKDISYSFKFLTTDLRRHDKVCGYVYTELADIEFEHNGFVNYDRTAKQFGYDAFFPGMTVADLNRADFVGLDCPPCQTLAPGDPFRAPAFVSHWDTRPLDGAQLCWRATFVDRWGESRLVDEGRRGIELRRYGVSDAGVVAWALPDEPGLATVALWLEDADGLIRARNYVNVDVYGGRAAPERERLPGGWALRFRPGDYADCSWAQPSLGPGGSKLGIGGTGFVEYAVRLPDELVPATVRGLRFLFEAGARTAASRRLGWKRTWHGASGHYPQTEARAFPSDLSVSINNIALGVTRLPDDPADARGVLSAHLAPHFEYASYGFLTRLQADAATARRIVQAAPSGDLVVRFEIPSTGVAGGLNVYGARMGAFPVEPTLFVDTEGAPG